MSMAPCRWRPVPAAVPGSVVENEDLAARLEALQRDVMQLKTAPPEPAPAVAAPPVPSHPVHPLAMDQAPSSRGALGGSVSAGGVSVTMDGEDSSEEESEEEAVSSEEEESEEEEEEEEEEEVLPLAAQPKKAARPDVDLAKMLEQKKQLEAQAAETNGAGMGAGSVFKRPSPAEMLKQASAKAPPEKKASPGRWTLGGVTGANKAPPPAG
ncbi:hypothetical protein T484DRAFT_1773668, partial [Baffinella frigidus]